MGRPSGAENLESAVNDRAGLTLSLGAVLRSSLELCDEVDRWDCSERFNGAVVGRLDCELAKTGEGAALA